MDPHWRRENVVLSRNGAILYPGNMPCPDCGLEIGEDRIEKSHPFEQLAEAAEVEDICAVCGWHESYHRDHDCVKDAYEPMPCACAGGQPWSCCTNRYARQEQYLLQKLANVLRAAACPPSAPECP